MKILIKKQLENFGWLQTIQNWRGRIIPTKYQKEQIEKLSKAINFYSQFISNGDICFDVGANIGNRVEIFLKMGLKIIAIEPQAECITILKKRFGNKIIIVDKALGSKDEEAIMYLSNATTLASLSKEWIDKVKNERFAEFEWKDKHIVSVTTLQRLIEQFGNPIFCKIDVEGHELEVLKGMKDPIKTLSFEFAIPESTDTTINCVNYLGILGYNEFSYSLGESMQLAIDKWLTKEEMIREFKDFYQKGISWGDIYAKFS